jgi:putative FmdB family regulatory protein
VPIYEYQCEHCEHKMEAIQKISDAPLKACPECEQETLRKLVSAAAFKLTGAGWYETDFKHDKSKVKEDKKPSKGDGDKTKTTKETKSKEAGKTGGNSESKTDRPKKKESTAKSEG